MGWTFQERTCTADQEFRQQLEPSFEVLESALVHLSTYYAAIRFREGPHKGRVICFVALVRYRADGWWGYKDMDEMMGPCEVDCPKRVFEQLTPLDDAIDSMGYARSWRDRVREHHAKQAERRARRAKLEVGQRVELVNYEHYSGRPGQFFKIVDKQSGRIRARSEADGYAYRFPRSATFLPA